MMEGYCISSVDGYPVLDEDLCNTCQKCVAVCPSRALLVDGVRPDRIEGEDAASAEELVSLFERRRSTKRFKAVPIPKELIERVVSVAKYAPNQNKNIAILVIDDPQLIALVDEEALAFVRVLYRLLFAWNPLSPLISLVSRNFRTIRRKMEYDLLRRGHVVKDNTQALIVLVGDRATPTTASSALYLAGTMLYMAEVLGLGTCLVDSILLAFRTRRRLRKRFRIQTDALAVLALGYSDERVLNIPRGYEVELRWNA
jgi:nitroreductase